MVNSIISNTGPIIHLSEIDAIKAFSIFKNILIPREVMKETIKNRFRVPRSIKVMRLEGKYKDYAQLIMDRYSLDSGEAHSIALAFQEKSGLFLTDDIEARTIAEIYDIEVHGTLGILLRAFRENIFDQNTVSKKIIKLYDSSSLFITKDLINYALAEIKKFNKK